MVKKEKVASKVVLDTNTLISALLFRGGLSVIVDLWKNGTIKPVFSSETFTEFKSVLSYPKFSLTRHEIKVIIEQEVLPYFDVVEIDDEITDVCRDPDDDKFISCAVSAAAGYIVSGDKDLLEIGTYSGVRIISGATFIKKIT